MDEVNVDEVNVNEVNEEFAMIEDSGEVCGVKEEMSKGKSLEIEAKVEVNGKSEEVVTAKPPDVLQRFDFTAKVQVEEFGMKVVKNSEEVKKSQEDKEVEILLPMKEVEESRHANWDPGELIDAKAQIEMFSAKVEVMPSGDVNALFDAMSLFNLVRLYTSEVLVLVLVARNAARFVDVNPLSSRSFAESFLPILSDYG